MVIFLLEKKHGESPSNVLLVLSGINILQNKNYIFSLYQKCQIFLSFKSVFLPIANRSIETFVELMADCVLILISQ